MESAADFSPYRCSAQTHKGQTSYEHLLNNWKMEKLECSKVVYIPDTESQGEFKETRSGIA